MNQKGFANIILVVVIVILVGAVGYFAFVKKSAPIAQQTPTPPPGTSSKSTNPAFQSKSVSVYTVSQASSTNFPIVKTLNSVKIGNSATFPKELRVGNFIFTVSEVKFNITAEGKKLYLSLAVKYPDNETSRIMGKTEVVDTICDIVFDLSTKTTCMPIHGILISSQTSNEFNGKPVYSHTISHIIQITEIGYVPSLKAWDHFILSEVERHEVYETLD